MERRLAAILAADVVGFSRLMEIDEPGTLITLKGHHSELLNPKIAEHQGRIVKLTGDGVLVEFHSVLEAVACAVDVQRAMIVRNQTTPPERRIEFRIGVNLGDVIVDGDDIFSDGVNVASRLESAAWPGGIAVSASVRDLVGGRLDIRFEDAGDQKFKNIARPIHVFQVILDGQTPGQIRQTVGRPLAADSPRIVVDRPSIAVLPFDTNETSRENVWFSDGIAEDIITSLGKSSHLFIISRNFSFAYRTRKTRPEEIGRELGVKYLLDGSARILGNRVRITAQLTDTSSGELIWADRFDRTLEDIFEIQDEITEAVASSLELKLLPEEKRAISLTRTQSIEAYNYALKGRQLLLEWTRSHLVLARKMFVKAVELDPLYARALAHIVICDCYLLEWDAAEVSVAEMLDMATQAIGVDPSLPEAHAARGFALYCAGRFAEAEQAYAEALSIDTHCYEANFFLGMMARFRGDRSTALTCFKVTTRLRAEDYFSPMVLMSLDAEDRDECLKWARICLQRAEQAIARHPGNPAPLHRGALALVHLGERNKALSWIEAALALDPDDPITLYNAACVWSLLGEVERALDQLERSVARISKNTLDMIQHDPDLYNLRNHPRYDALLRRL